MKNRLKTANAVAPHEYEKAVAQFGFLGLLRREFCRRCYLPESTHPTGWTEARPLGDLSPVKQRSLAEVVQELKAMRRTKGNDAYLTGYAHALEWVLGATIPEWDSGTVTGRLPDNPAGPFDV